MRLFALLAFLWSSIGFAQSYCVKSNGVELRQSPDGNSPVSWTVGKYMPLQGTGKKKKSFVEVQDLDGETHWVRRNQVTSSPKCLVVKVKSARMKSGPGDDFGQVAISNFDRYTPFRDLGGEDGWTKVRDDIGGEAWIHLDQIWKAAGFKVRMSFDGEE